MDQTEKSAALDALSKSKGWEVLFAFHKRNSYQEILPIDSLDSLIKQAYYNGICKAHKDTLDYVKTMVDSYRRKNAYINKTITIDELDITE